MAYRTSSPEKQDPAEIIALAIAELPPGLTLDKQLGSMGAAFVRAKAALAVKRLRAAGYVIVPREPTEAMIAAAEELSWGPPGTFSDEHPEAFPDNVWVAMVEAAT